MDRIQDGYVYWFRRTEDELRKVVEFALFESKCCDFLDFGIGLNTEGTRISLRISGPRGTGDFLQLAMKGKADAIALASGPD